MKKDHRRDLYLQQQGLKVLRFSDRDVLMNISGVQQKIYEEIERCLKIDETPPQSSPKRGGRNNERGRLGGWVGVLKKHK